MVSTLKSVWHPVSSFWGGHGRDCFVKKKTPLRGQGGATRGVVGKRDDKWDCVRSGEFRGKGLYLANEFRVSDVCRICHTGFRSHRRSWDVPENTDGGGCRLGDLRPPSWGLSCKQQLVAQKPLLPRDVERRPEVPE